MASFSGLENCSLVAFVNIRDAGSAKSFYRDTLGLRMVEEELPFALVFDANGIMLRLAINPRAEPIAGTVLGWQVPDVEAAVDDLLNKGVRFERYGFLEQDSRGIWNTPTGARVAWFKDPDGNLLSLTQHPL